MMPSFLNPSTPEAFTKPTSPPSFSPSAGPLPGLASHAAQTTLSQRFRRAVKQDDLELARRIATKALELQQHRRPSAYKALEPAGLASPSPPKAALRAALAQRPSSSQPFDVRNVQHADLDGQRAKLVQRDYSLGANYEQGSNDAAEPSLILAIKHNGDVELMRWLIEMGHEQRGASVDMHGHTILHLAALYDRADVVYAYSTYSSVYVAVPTVELVDAVSHHDRRSALHLACIKGHEDVARQLLDIGADIDVADCEGNTALHCASAWGHLSLVQLLIERGCSFAAQNHQGSTAADFAFSHSVKAALEAFGRAQFESRKRTRRGQNGTGPVAAASAGRSVRRSLDDEPHSGGSGKPRTDFKPPPLPLGVIQAVKGIYSPKPIPPRSATFAGFDGHGHGHDLDSSAAAISNDVFYDDWDPERTFAQPGQDLHAGNRNGVTSPKKQAAASPNHSGGGGGVGTHARPSVDVYGEYLAQAIAGRTPSEVASDAGQSNEAGHVGDPVKSVASVGLVSSGRAAPSSSPRPSLSEERRRAPTDHGRRSPLAQAQSDSLLRHQMLQSAASSLARRASPNPSNGTSDSPSTGSRHRLGSLADQARAKDHIAVSHFRRGLSEAPERHASPPISAANRVPDGRATPSGSSMSPPQHAASLSSSLPTSSTLASPSRTLLQKDLPSIHRQGAHTRQHLLDLVVGGSSGSSKSQIGSGGASRVVAGGGAGQSDGGHKGNNHLTDHDKRLVEQLKILL